MKAIIFTIGAIIFSFGVGGMIEYNSVSPHMSKDFQNWSIELQVKYLEQWHIEKDALAARGKTFLASPYVHVPMTAIGVVLCFGILLVLANELRLFRIN